MLEIQNLSVSYRGSLALQEISCTFAPGEMVGILGPNGAGKSTLIKAMLGLLPNVMGRTLWRGRPLQRQLDRVAYVPQRNQIDWDYPITAWHVVMMGRTIPTGLFRRPSQASVAMVKEALDRVGMYDLKDRPIGELSGGQQQRIFIARALAQQADLFLLDEPFVGVDQKTEQIMFNIFQELKEENKTILIVNHDLKQTLHHFDRFVLLNRRLIAIGDRESVITPDNLARAYGVPLELLVA